MMNATPDGDEDSEDSSSSPYQNISNQFRSALDEFRDKWQQELKNDLSANNDSTNDVDNGVKNVEESIGVDDDESRAEQLFKQGIEYEQRGKVYDALQFYRRAVQIVPDIEFRIYESSKTPIRGQNIEGTNHQSQKREDGDLSILNENCSEGDDEDLSTVDLYSRFQTSLQDGRLISRATSARTISTQTHISDLPMEIILYILRWVISSHLDARSLEQCAATCKGLYICARDEELWKQMCLKASGLLTHPERGSRISWRQMFIETQRIRFNGCYISKTSYLRYGENSFQDQFYRPVQLIEYYRFMRFFPDGTIVTMTSAEDPSQIVGKLKNPNHLREALKGHYRIHGDIIIIMLKAPETHTKKKTTAATYDDADGNTKHTFYIELKVSGTSKRKSCQLQWKRYSIIQIKNKREISSEFELSAAKYPPLWFSRVKSYHLEAEAPLQ